MKICGIYQILNLVTDERYIGGSVDIMSRFNYHRRCALNKWPWHKALSVAVAQYGVKAFQFEILLLCDRGDLTFFESRAIEVLKPAYNVRKVREVDHAPKCRRGTRRPNQLLRFES